MSVRWSQDLSVGVEAIDRQHKSLIDMVNSFEGGATGSSAFADMAEKDRKLKIYMLLLNLREYFLNHFGAEERMLITCRYPEFLDHKKEHDSFIRQVFELENRYLEGDLLMAKELQDFLGKWVVNHIGAVDKKYAAHVAKFLGTGEAPEISGGQKG